MGDHVGIPGVVLRSSLLFQNLMNSESSEVFCWLQVTICTPVRGLIQTTESRPNKINAVAYSIGSMQHAVLLQCCRRLRGLLCLALELLRESSSLEGRTLRLHPDRGQHKLWANYVLLLDTFLTQQFDYTRVPPPESSVVVDVCSEALYCSRRNSE